jgi:zinc-ribbon domain
MSMIKCPYCAEQIQDAAVLCRWCGSDLRSAPSGARVAFAGRPGEESSDHNTPSLPPAETVSDGNRSEAAAGTPPAADRADARASIAACPQCHGAIGDGDAFCRTCGFNLKPAAGPPPAASSVPPPGNVDERGGATTIPHYGERVAASFMRVMESVSSPANARRWWRAPGIAALAAIAGTFLVCMALYALFYLISDAGSGTYAGPNPFQMGLLVLYVFQRVPVTVAGAGPILEAVNGKFQFVPLGGLLLLGVVIMAAARYAARDQERESDRLSAVLRFAVLFALLSFLASFLASATTESFQIGVSHAGALWWPFLWVSLFGWIAIARAGRSRAGSPGLQASRRGGRLRTSIVAGALTGARAGLGLATPAVLVVLLAAMDRIPTDASPRSVLGLVIVALLLLPNLVSWAVLAGMGATIQAGASVFGFAGSGSVGIFGAAGAGAAGTHVPAYWLLLMVIPFVATVSAGFVAARAADGPTDLRAALGAGTLLVLGCWLLAWISGGRLRGDYGNTTLAVSTVAATFLPLLWALGGGCLGALLNRARQQAAVRRASPTTSTVTVPVVGLQSSVSCPRCGEPNDSGSRFCEMCGGNLVMPI